MSSARPLVQKVKELIEKIGGCHYGISWSDGRLYWGLKPTRSADKSQVGGPCYVLPSVEAFHGPIVITDGAPNMARVLENSYDIRIAFEEFDKLLNPNVRKRLEKIIPAVVKDYEIVCNGIEEATKKYGLPSDSIRFKNAVWMKFAAEFDPSNMSDDEILKAIEPRFMGLAEIEHRFYSWRGLGVEFSPERQALVEKGARVPGLPGRLRSPGLLVIDWPPNTGDPEKDKRVFNRVKEWLEKKLGIVFTPEGRLKLVDREIVLVRPKGGSK